MAFTSNTEAFLNGKGTDDETVFPGGFDPKEPSDRTKFYQECYSTHDWIAEAALEAVLYDSTTKNKWNDKDGAPFWTEERKVIFLMGTEAPDRGKTVTLNDRTIRIFADKNKHHLRFIRKEADPSVRMKPSDKAAADRAADYARRAKTVLERGECDLGAFYIGVALHYIGDMACFSHVIAPDEISPTPTKSDWEHRHDQFEIDVASKTSDHSNREQTPYFSYKKMFDVENEIPTVQNSKAVLQLTLLVGWQTRWNHKLSSGANLAITPTPDSYVQHSGVYDAVWLYENYVSGVDNWIEEYKWTIQQNLDQAVICSAKAINIIADSWNKECIDCDDEPELEKITTQMVGNMLTWIIVVTIILGISNVIGLGFAQAILVPISGKSPIGSKAT